MANKTSVSGTSNTKTAAEIRTWYEENKDNIERYAKAQDSVKLLRDVTKISTRTISTIDKNTLKGYFNNIGGNEKNLRKLQDIYIIVLIYILD